MAGVDIDVLRLHILYLEKLDTLNPEEREVYVKYFDALSKPVFITGVDIGIDLNKKI